ncbi:hypothetical protein LCGC14_2831850 [marine sediment metagenome]|uniref:Uncharacterized protein n=1 Tax=marine sediment metagenome TaxID=412755 RepID=A0A0F9AM87_9ZZZZ
MKPKPINACIYAAIKDKGVDVLTDLPLTIYNAMLPIVRLADTLIVECGTKDTAIRYADRVTAMRRESANEYAAASELLRNRLPKPLTLKVKNEQNQTHTGTVDRYTLL